MTKATGLRLSLVDHSVLPLEGRRPHPDTSRAEFFPNGCRNENESRGQGPLRTRQGASWVNVDPCPSVRIGSRTVARGSDRVSLSCPNRTKRGWEVPTGNGGDLASDPIGLPASPGDRRDEHENHKRKGRLKSTPILDSLVFDEREFPDLPVRSGTNTRATGGVRPAGAALLESPFS